MTPAPIADHLSAGINRLLEQYKNQPNILGIATAFAHQVQDLEDTLAVLLLLRKIDIMVGSQLDGVGNLVGEKRNGRSDSVYQMWLTVRIAINISSGTIPDLIRIMNLVLDNGQTLSITNGGLCCVVVHIGTGPFDLDPKEMKNALDQARVAGVRLILEYALDFEFSLFKWDGTGAQAWDNGTLAAAL